MTPEDAAAVARDACPGVLAALARRHDFADAEDAAQEAVVEALTTWPRDGLPERPAAWLQTVATRRLVDQVRAEAARRRRERRVADEARPPPTEPDPEPVAGDDVLDLFFLCAHPALGRPAQLALTLRALGGLTTAQIAAALLVEETTLAQRVVRAKARLRGVGARFVPLTADDRADRLPVVLQVLYLLFTEGHTASGGAALRRVDLTAEALRLARRLHGLLPGPGEPAGLLALMLLTEARGATRVDAEGELVVLADQDRTRWDASAIAEGTTLFVDSLAGAPVGPYQVQAAIAAVHAEAPSVAETDWAQVLALYDLLERLAPGPAVTLNRAVAVGEVHGPRTALAVVDDLARGSMAGHHRVDAVRGHLLEAAGDRAAAAAAFRAAAREAGSEPERRHLLRRTARMK